MTERPGLALCVFRTQDCRGGGAEERTLDVQTVADVALAFEESRGETLAIKCRRARSDESRHAS